MKSLEDLIAEGKKFGTIYADPPWRYNNAGTRSAAAKEYGTMAVEEIMALPVAQLAEDDAHLHLWTTNAFLFESKYIIEAWGFTYKSMLVWVKPQMGIGNYWRVSHEILLLGVRGRCPFGRRDFKSWVEHQRTPHSVKPESVRHMVEAVSPEPRLEMFARRPTKGWTAWGNDVRRRSLYDEAV